MSEKNKKLIKILVVALLCAIIAILSCVCTYFITINGCQSESQEIDAYELAMGDSITIDEDEILPLVSITKDSPMVTWDESGEKVLMISWHKYPDSYKKDSSFVCEYGEIWTFTDKEILSWYQDNSDGVKDWELRFEQLIGLPEDKEYTHFSAFWVDEEELIRPAFQTDITKQLTKADLDGGSLGDYESWFNGNEIWSYVDSAYPWTRLGYTYDWTNDGQDYGLSEFIILPNSTIEVAWTVTTAEFINMLEQGVLA